MKETLSVVLWLVLTVAAITTVVFVVQTMRSKEEVSIGLYRNGQNTIWFLIYIALAAMGGMAIVGVGVFGLLTWLPSSFDEFRGMLALGAAFLSLYVLEHLSQVTFERQQHAVNFAAKLWISSHIGDFSTPSDSVIERLKEESQNPSLKGLEYLIASEKLVLAKELKERDERMEVQVIRRLRQEQEEKVAEEVERKYWVSQAAQESKKSAEKQAWATQVKAALSRLVRVSPTVSTIDDLRQGEEAVIENDLIKDSWHRFTDLTDRALLPQSKGQLALLLQKLPGVSLRDDVNLQLQYSGALGHADCNEWDGYCDAYVIVDGKQLPLREGLKFTGSIEGIINAFFLAACLPRQWSWGHGLYDRDHQLINSISALENLFTNDPTATKLETFEEKWPPVGVRIIQNGNTFEVACLAFRPGRGISDLSMSVTDGKASVLSEREVYIWGGGIFY